MVEWGAGRRITHDHWQLHHPVDAWLCCPFCETTHRRRCRRQHTPRVLSLETLHALCAAPASAAGMHSEQHPLSALSVTGTPPIRSWHRLRPSTTLEDDPSKTTPHPPAPSPNTTRQKVAAPQLLYTQQQPPRWMASTITSSLVAVLLGACLQTG